MGVSESFGDFSEQLWEFVIGIRYSILGIRTPLIDTPLCHLTQHLAIQGSPKGQKKTKKKPGVGKKVRVKNGT